MSDKRPHPPLAGNELDTLCGWLDFHRATLVEKLDGLTEEQARHSPVGSGTSILNLVRHLAYVEHWWFSMAFANTQVVTGLPWDPRDPEGSQWNVLDGETISSIVAMYEKECAISREIVSNASSLDVRCKLHDEDMGDMSEHSLRWVMSHMVEETARHVGHADIIRELIDGRTGD